MSVNEVCECVVGRERWPMRPHLSSGVVNQPSAMWQAQCLPALPNETWPSQSPPAPFPPPPRRSFDIPPRSTDQPMGGGAPAAFLQTSQTEQLNMSHHATKAQRSHIGLWKGRDGGLGEGGTMFTEPPWPLGLIEPGLWLKPLLTRQEPTTASCLLALAEPAVRISWLHFEATAHWPGCSPLPETLSYTTELSITATQSKESEEVEPAFI